MESNDLLIRDHIASPEKEDIKGVKATGDAASAKSMTLPETEKTI